MAEEMDRRSRALPLDRLGVPQERLREGRSPVLLEPRDLLILPQPGGRAAAHASASAGASAGAGAGVGGAATDPGPGPYPTVVCFHGMAMRIEPMIRWMSDLFDTPWAWLFLEAPYPVERKIGGVRTIGYAWYAFDGDTPAFRDSLRRSEARVLSLLPDRASAWNLDVTRMVVLGFSQGAYFAGSVGLRHAERFRGIVCAGGRIRPAYSGRSPETVPKLPILFLHGRDDATIPIEDARSAAEEMRGLGFPVEWRDVEGRHRWNPAMSEALRPWLSERFTEADPPGSR